MSENTKTNGTVPVGDALLGRAINAAGEPIDGRGPLGDLAQMPIDRPAGLDAVAGVRAELLESGIKVIDLSAPLVRGGVIAMIGGVGVGKIVLTSELIQHVATRRGGCAVMAMQEDPTVSTGEFLAELRSAGIENHTALVIGHRDDSPELKQQIALMGLTLAEYLCDQGREMLLFLDENLVTGDTLARLLGRRRGGPRAALTLLVWQYETPVDVGDEHILHDLLRERDGRIVFSPTLAKQSIWPAVDPLASGSRLLSEQQVSAEHVRIARAARELLAGYSGLAGGAGDDPVLQGRARKVLLFQSQPFVVAEPFTGVPGEYVAVEETLRGFGEIAAGLHDNLPDEAFRFTGTLGQVLARIEDRG